MMVLFDVLCCNVIVWCLLVLCIVKWLDSLCSVVMIGVCSCLNVFGSMSVFWCSVFFSWLSILFCVLMQFCLCRWFYSMCDSLMLSVCVGLLFFCIGSVVNWCCLMILKWMFVLVLIFFCRFFVNDLQCLVVIMVSVLMFVLCMCLLFWLMVRCSLWLSV